MERLRFAEVVSCQTYKHVLQVWLFQEMDRWTGNGRFHPAHGTTLETAGPPKSLVPVDVRDQQQVCGGPENTP